MKSASRSSSSGESVEIRQVLVSGNPQADVTMPAARHPGWATLVAAILLVLAIFVAYGTPLMWLVRRWWSDPEYVYGFLVPFFAGAMLWVRRDLVVSYQPRTSLWGLPLIAIAGAMRLAAAYWYSALLQPLSLVSAPGGNHAFRWWVAGDPLGGAFDRVLGFRAVPLPGAIGGVAQSISPARRNDDVRDVCPANRGHSRRSSRKCDCAQGHPIGSR